MPPADLTERLAELLPQSVWPASQFERTAAIAAGLPLPYDAECWCVGTTDSTPLAYLVMLPGDSVDERRARAVSAVDVADPVVAEAVASAREALITALREL
jgi:hypothetical protein